jgi:hypothetical protein
MDMCMDKGMKRVAAGNRLVAGFVEPEVAKCRVWRFAGFVAFAGFAAVAGFPIQTLCADDTGAPSKNILCMPLR